MFPLPQGKEVGLLEEACHPLVSRALGLALMVVPGLDELPLFCGQALEEVLPSNEVLRTDSIADGSGEEWGQHVEALEAELSHSVEDGPLDAGVGLGLH